MLALEHDEPSPAARDELLEDLGKVLRDLLESALDGLVLPCVEDVDELEDRLLRVVELLLPRKQLVALLREGRVLLVGLLVDVGEAFERLVHLAKLLEQLRLTNAVSELLTRPT